MPRSQRSLITLVLHKLLSSSSFAIAGTLKSIIDRLQNIVKDNTADEEDDEALMSDLQNDIEELEEYEDEWIDEDDEENDGENDEESREYTEEDIRQIKAEMTDLQEIYELALSIAENQKGECLLKALSIAFDDKRKHNQPEKALIFTESNRTLQYLKQLLEENGYDGKIVLFNGSNSDPKSKDIYKNWKDRYAGTSRITGSATADKRQALVDYFREEAQIMIATEAASEGINLQFCSLLVNYDMPWNPQRVEQRIGRCHRYGQKNDVVVVNFINKANRADQRVYELLDEKYNLFKGVFGSSDEVLGNTIEGIDFEQRVLEIYRTCRSTAEIDKAFDRLREDMRQHIEEVIDETEVRLIENFDQDVVNRLRIRKDKNEQQLNQFYKLLWNLSVSMLDDNIGQLDEEHYQFTLRHSPNDADQRFETGPYRMGKDVNDAYIYRIGHPLAQYLLSKAKRTDTQVKQTVVFNYSGTVGKVSVIESQLGKSGTLMANLVHYHSPKEDEDRILAVAVDANGNVMPDDFVEKLMSISGTIIQGSRPNIDEAMLNDLLNERRARMNAAIAERDKKYIDDESDKITRWAEDQTFSLEEEIRQLKKQIKEKDRLFRAEKDEQRRRQLQVEIQDLEREQKNKRRDLFTAEDEVEERRRNLISKIDDALAKATTEEKLFSIGWQIA